MKRYLGIAISLVLLAVTVAYLVRRPSPAQKVKGQEGAVALLEERWLTLFVDADYTLIALKHGIAPEIARDVIADYEKASWDGSTLEILEAASNPGQERNKTAEVLFPEASNTEQIVAAIAQKYQVSTAIVAGILFDYRLLTESSSDSE